MGPSALLSDMGPTTAGGASMSPADTGERTCSLCTVPCDAFSTCCAMTASMVKCDPPCHILRTSLARLSRMQNSGSGHRVPKVSVKS